MITSITDAQILRKLRSRKSPQTAADLGLASRHGVQRLRSMEGVAEVGVKRTGKRGRPAAIFTSSESAVRDEQG